MSKPTKRTSHPIATAADKKAKLDAFKQETDDEGSAPSAVSCEGKNKAYKQETHDEADDNSPTAATSAATAPSAASAASNISTVLTFTTAHDKFARLQLLSNHTLHDLVATLCEHTPVGYQGSEGADDHLWYITHQGKAYESSDHECRSPLRANRTKLQALNLENGGILNLTYDYGSTSTYTVILMETENLSDEEDVSSFPRNQPRSGLPATYQKYQPQTTTSWNLLDASFFYLNDWVFHKANSVSIHLFQPGRKKNYGFMDNKFTMMYLPAKPDSLANWLECFNRGASIKPKGVEKDGYAHYTWQSVVVLPQSNLTPQLRKKHKNNEERGFCDGLIVEDHSSHPGATVESGALEKLFPKIAALAGLKKDKHVPKGWITFTKRGKQCSLAVCTGNAKEAKKSHAPKGLAFEGENQHDPVEEPLFQISGGVEIKGLQDLFCVVEGLLRTLS